MGSVFTIRWLGDSSRPLLLAAGGWRWRAAGGVDVVINKCYLCEVLSKNLILLQEGY